MKRDSEEGPLLIASGTKLFLLNGAVTWMQHLVSLTREEKLSMKQTTDVYHAVHGVPLSSDQALPPSGA